MDQASTAQVPGWVGGCDSSWATRYAHRWPLLWVREFTVLLGVLKGLLCIACGVLAREAYCGTLPVPRPGALPRAYGSGGPTSKRAPVANSRNSDATWATVFVYSKGTTTCAVWLAIWINSGKRYRYHADMDPITTSAVALPENGIAGPSPKLLDEAPNSKPSGTTAGKRGGGARSSCA